MLQNRNFPVQRYVCISSRGPLPPLDLELYSRVSQVLLGSLGNAFQIAQRLGSLQDILHIRSCAQQVGDTGLMAQINTFLAYNAPRTLNGKKQL